MGHYAVESEETFLGEFLKHKKQRPFTYSMFVSLAGKTSLDNRGVNGDVRTVMDATERNYYRKIVALDRLFCYQYLLRSPLKLVSLFRFACSKFASYMCVVEC